MCPTDPGVRVHCLPSLRDKDMETAGETGLGLDVSVILIVTQTSRPFGVVDA